MHLEALNKKNQELFGYLKYFKDFYLAGGTALALQIGHRISVDFDLFLEKDIPKTLFSQVKEIFKNKKVIASVNNIDELTVFVDDVKLSFIKYPFPRILLLVNYEGVNLLSVKEIAATKAYVIGRRGSFKDYIDLYFIFSEGRFSLEEIISLAEKKYKDEFNARLFLEQFIYLEDIEDTDIIFLKDKIDKNVVTNFFENEVRKIKLN
jgi:hypothetical protein